MLSEDEMRRLTFIKYLYGLGVEQSRQSQPHASAAILTLHDAVELFLHLAAEHHKVEVGKKTLDFADYFGRLEANPPGLKPTGTQSMLRLNQARVGLKHHANLPDEATVKDLVGRVSIFFEDNIPVLFGVGFKDLSLINLVTHPEVRRLLGDAETHLHAGEMVEAMGEIALAFHHLVFDYTVRSFARPMRSPFNFGTKPKLRSSFMMGVKDPKLSPFIDEVEKLGESVQALQSAVQITSLGLDYRRYAKFRMLTPRVWTAIGGVHHVMKSEANHSLEDCRFCLDFVIECALKLQDFDYGAMK